MALEISYSDEYGNVNTSAYVRIISVELDYGSSLATINVFYYKDVDARQNNKKAIHMQSYGVVNSDIEPKFDEYFAVTVLSAADINPIQSAYAYLKTLPEYSDAVDV